METEMKTKLKKTGIVLFKIVVIIFLVITLNRIFMPKYVYENQDGRITREYYAQSRYSEVIFVGSSTVHSAIDPLVLWQEKGISSYVRANASQPMWISYYMIEDALKCHKPKLVCLDMTFIKYADDFVEEPSTRKALDGMRLSSSKIKCIEASMGEDEKMADYLMPLFRFHSRWKELSIDDIKLAYYNKPVTLNGYLKDDGVAPVTEKELVYTKEGDLQLSPRNIEYLRKSIELCQKNGVEIFLFKTPAHSSNWSVGYDEQIGKIAGEYNVNYINFDEYNDIIGLDYSTDTPDEGSHLNSFGADKFSEYLAGYLADNYEIKDQRNERRFADNWARINAQNINR
ncbi:MAG: SGNH/GDSL hydrolase family protein [Lachnospiraceae bacterium]|nr:SGNH/GDSL hydrolase family protein [Lachnospiraceae bacterium]